MTSIFASWLSLTDELSVSRLVVNPAKVNDFRQSQGPLCNNGKKNAIVGPDYRPLCRFSR